MFVNLRPHTLHWPGLEPIPVPEQPSARRTDHNDALFASTEESWRPRTLHWPDLATMTVS
jgi:hypothetical protein